MELHGQLYESQEETAPRYPSEHKSFRRNCGLLCSLSKVPKHLFEKRISKLRAPLFIKRWLTMTTYFGR
ncbi:hypothetical protein ACQKWADRAFT_293653 [Trichoderma austrokoningii]